MKLFTVGYEGFLARDRMFADYVKKILPIAKDELADLLILAKTKKLAILCYEADALDCHRHFVGVALKKMAKGKLKVDDLKPLSKSVARR